MHDPPGLEVRDDLLDHVAYLVDLRIEFFLPAQEAAAGWLPDGSEHIFSDVALVAYPAAWLECFRDAGFGEAVGIVAASVYRVGDPGESSVKRAGDLHVHSRCLMLAGVQFRVRGP